MPEIRIASLAGGNIGVPEEAIGRLSEGLRGRLIRPTDGDYHEARAVWNGMIDKRPALIVRVAGVADVIRAVSFCREHGVLVAVRGGGHSVAGTSVCDGGVVIDLSLMRGVWVDPAARSATVQGGATWGDLDQETQAFGLATPGGLVSDTGIAGLTLGGGIGLLCRKHGLTCDNLIAADVVTADGQYRHASETEHPDLLWALKGGGGNFGVVTNFVYRLHPVGPEITYVLPVYPVERATEVMRAYRDYALSAPDEVALDALMWSAGDAEPYPPALRGRPGLFILGAYAGPPEEGRRVLQPLLELGTPLIDLGATLPYLQAQRLFDEDYPAGQYHYWKSLYIDDVSDAALEAFVAQGLSRLSPATSVELFALGGAIASVPVDATAYGRRDAPFVLAVEANWTDPSENEAQVAWARGVWQAMQPYSRGGLYVNFPGMGEEGAALLHATYGPNYARLVEVKTRYDPDNMFRLNQNIQPLTRART